eukprot:2506121-Karenia_brevis.AAC.1
MLNFRGSTLVTAGNSWVTSPPRVTVLTAKFTSTSLVTKGNEHNGELRRLGNVVRFTRTLVKP